MSVIETLGETASGWNLETVRLPKSKKLRLHAHVGRAFTTARTFRHHGNTFVPQSLDAGLVQAVRFPPPSAPFGSVQDLTSSLCAYFRERAHLNDETTSILVAFVLATWFCDAFDVAPILHVFGPDSEVSRCLRLLACFCRRPILLGHADLGSLSSLPKGLAATLVINQRDLGERLSHILVASRRRHFCTACGNGRTDLYGAKVFACDETVPGQHGLEISLPPALEPLPLFTDAEQEEVAEEFQAGLLRYRLVRHEQVCNLDVDCSSFPPELREEAQSWLAPINDCGELTESVVEALRRQENEIGSARWTDPRCVIAEAALHFCHTEGIDRVFVGEIAEAADTLLQARHGEPTLSARRTGAILRQIGIQGTRDARGFRIDLNDQLRAKIHHVASTYRVASLAAAPRCRHCAESAEPDSANL